MRFEESIYYANVDNFKYKVVKFSKMNVAEILAKINKEKSEYAQVLNQQKILKVLFQLEVVFEIYNFKV